MKINFKLPKLKVPKTVEPSATADLKDRLRRFGLPAAAGLLLIILVVMFTLRGGSAPDKAPSAGQPAPGRSGAPPVDTDKTSGRTGRSIAGAIEHKNTSAIKTYLGSKLKVVVIEGDNQTSGTLSASQAAKLLKKLKGAKGPWNWDIDDQTLAQWIQGPYGQYFYSQDNTATVVTGISSNGYVVSILINGQGQVVDYLIVSDANVLLPGTNQNSQPPPTTIKPDNPKATE